MATFGRIAGSTWVHCLKLEIERDRMLIEAGQINAREYAERHLERSERILKPKVIAFNREDLGKTWH